jgi:Fe-S oxidoreductase
MAAYKAEFLHHHYAGRLRPRAMLALALLPWAARAATRAPRLTNALLAAPGVGPAGRRMAGITTARPVPRLAPRPFRRSPIAAARRDRDDATVVVWPDTFTNAFRPGIAADLVAVLEATGERVAVPSGWACCGRTLYDFGMLGVARRSLARLLDVLEPWASRGVPVVVPESSCLAAFRDELPALLSDDPRAAVLASLARSPAEHLLASPGFDVAAGARRGDRVDAEPARAVVHPHCHGRAVGTTRADREILQRLGFAPQILDAGCCGLAGSFGYRAEHEPLSRRIGEEHWLPRVRAATEAADGGTLVVDGFSCATQLEQLSDLESTPLITLVRRLLGC